MTEKQSIKIVVPKTGPARWVHSDLATELMTASGDVTIRRASHVDQWHDLSDSAKNKLSDAQKKSWFVNGWWVDLSPVKGRILGPFKKRQEALDAELAWLQANKIPVAEKEPDAAA